MSIELIEGAYALAINVAMAVLSDLCTSRQTLPFDRLLVAWFSLFREGQ